ncbi:MAG: peptidase M48 [Spartobacteria bacterium]|nr:peptidase M48 [Spartobacteria bacterium]
MKSSTVLFSLVLLPVGLLLCGCETVNKVTELGTTIAVSSGVIQSNEANSINRSMKAVTKTFEDITPEQEYYIGRAVTATLLTKYSPYNDDELTHYVNVLGQTLARASERPETFGGYHFLVVDSDEVNAFAAPGGLILLSRGLLKCCDSEDALAAVLAHEVGHVQHQDGLRAIKGSRLTSALTTLAAEGAKTLAGNDLAQVTEAFEGSINDITQTLAVNGYSRKQETQADAAAVEIMKRVGYDPNALIAMLHEMETQLKPGAADFAKTHPDPEIRIKNAQKQIGGFNANPAPEERQRRFDKAMAGIKG